MSENTTKEQLTKETEHEWLYAFDLGYNSSANWKVAEEFEKTLAPDSPQADAYHTGKLLYEQDREKETLKELQGLRQNHDERDRDMEQSLDNRNR